MCIKKNKKRSKKYSGLISITIFISFILSFAFYIIYNEVSSSNLSSLSCNTTRGIKICLEIPKTTYSSSENIEVVTYVKNTSMLFYFAKFECSSNDPIIYVNGFKISDDTKKCGKPTNDFIVFGMKKVFSQDIAASILGIGKRKILTKWDDYSTPNITITLEKSDKKESVAAKTSEKTCRKQISTSKFCDPSIVRLTK